jgi:hypothetical protein
VISGNQKRVDEEVPSPSSKSSFRRDQIPLGYFLVFFEINKINLKVIKGSYIPTFLQN